jgi:hypothetical protein
MQTVLFTGAGASRAIGYPLTSELLPRVRKELKTGALFVYTNGRKKDRRDRDELRRYLLGLLPGFKRVPDDQLPLITDVFSLVEHALVSGDALPIGGDASLRRCRDLLKQAITDVLLGDFLADWDDENADDRRERRVLRRFATWVHRQGAILDW